MIQITKQAIIRPKQIEAKHCPLIFLVVLIKFFDLQYLIKLVNIIIRIVIISIKEKRKILAIDKFDHLIIPRQQNNKIRQTDWKTIGSISKDFDVKL